MRTKIGFVMAGLILILVVGQVSATTFPVDDASIAAYVQVPNISLPDAVNAFYHVYELNNSYILGTIEIQNLGRKDYIKTYVGADGWIVAYVPRDVPAAQMIQWYGKDLENPTLFPTTLENAIEKVCNATGVNYSMIKDNIKYYDFEFPNATNIKIVIEEVKERQWQRENKFSVLIPVEIIVYDSSVALSGFCPGCVGTGYSVIGYSWDNQTVIQDDYVAVNEFWSDYADIPSNLLTKGETHWITTFASVYGFKALSATILIYSIP